MTAVKLSRRQLNRATLGRQLLLERAQLPVVQAVEQIAGMQAQEPKHPFIGLWTRLQGFDPRTLHGALHEREIVRATLMRSTLHLASAADYVALRMALQPPMSVAKRVLGARSKGLDLERVLPAARELLDGQPLAFDAIRAGLQERFPDVNERALGYAVRTLLPLVMVPGEGRWGYPRVADFALAEELLGAPVAAAAPEALVERYLGAFGPASAADVQVWSGVGRMAQVLDGMRERLEVFVDDRGRELFDLPGAPRPADDAPAPARLLPEFDSLLLAHDDRRRIVADAHRGAVVTKNLRVRATFLLDGFVAGLWTMKATTTKATLTLEPFGRLTGRDRAQLEPEAEQLLALAEPHVATRDVRLAS